MIFKTPQEMLDFLYLLIHIPNPFLTGGSKETVEKEKKKLAEKKK